MTLTEKEENLIHCIKTSRELNLPILIANVKLSNDELDTLIDLLEGKTTKIVYSVDISNVRELLQTIEEFNAK